MIFSRFSSKSGDSSAAALRPLVVKKDQADYYNLWSVKEVVIAGVIIQKGIKGFYFVPVYMDEEMKSIFA